MWQITRKLPPKHIWKSLSILQTSYAILKKTPHGWGITHYAVTEGVLNPDMTRSAYNRDLEESKERIIRHLGILRPDAFDDEPKN